MAVLYRRLSAVRHGSTQSKPMSLHDFKTHVAVALCSSTEELKRGRPLGSAVSGHKHGNKRRCDNDQSDSPQKKRKPTAPTSAPELRYDGLHHYPEYTNERMRCKKGSRSGQTRVICSNVTFLFAFRASRTASSLTTLSSAYYSFVLD